MDEARIQRNIEEAITLLRRGLSGDDILAIFQARNEGRGPTYALHPEAWATVMRRAKRRASRLDPIPVPTAAPAGPSELFQLDEARIQRNTEEAITLLRRGLSRDDIFAIFQARNEGRGPTYALHPEVWATVMRRAKRRASRLGPIPAPTAAPVPPRPVPRPFVPPVSPRPVPRPQLPSLHDRYRDHLYLPSLHDIYQDHRYLPSLHDLYRDHLYLPSLHDIYRDHRYLPSLHDLCRDHRYLPSLHDLCRDHRYLPSLRDLYRDLP
ncbi:hypothetical protein KFL_010130050 [Klebsormidium nitens]|uniref:Uncharacterized protein n=1 Tax=Klebsormidium nitens TaxID=105231 RepID=A0A1Y1IVY6_KLENI|nr:hypothetical protein KFL_010130050 [Klebsormidium nitens]|eukprot:GAQ92438.1 hypothetical protein KFL_010130050 [Klebsormidium nitens]